MAQVKTDNPLDFSGGNSGGHCHSGTPPITKSSGVQINGFYVLTINNEDGYSAIGCIDPHARLCSASLIPKMVFINGVPVFTSEDFIQCGELGGPGLYPVFIN